MDHPHLQPTHDMSYIATYLPELEGEEARFIYDLTREFSEHKSRLFASIYRARRKDPMFVLILTILGFFGVAGVQRVFIGKPVSGILYLLTLGLCFIGTIVDLLNFRGLTFEYNSKVALEVVRVL